MQVDPAEWRLEVERVAPRLKITVTSSARDWRSHLDDAHKHSAELSSLWPQAQTALSTVQTEVGYMHAATPIVSQAHVLEYVAVSCCNGMLITL